MGIGIRAETINIHLDGHWILHNLSFSIRPGEFVGVIGPNGAGKTTLLRALLGLLKPQSGTIQFPNGERIESGSTLLGYAPQSRSFDPESPLRAWDFVSFGLPNRIRPWLTKAEKKIVLEAMQATDTDRFRKRPMGRLSGGERQRLFVAQALVRHPQILLLDEPTANLDPGAQENLAEVVRQVNCQLGVTVVFVSHDVNLLTKHADRILYIVAGHGKLGTVEEVFHKDVLSAIYGVPVNVSNVDGKIFVHPASSSSITQSPLYSSAGEA